MVRRAARGRDLALSLSQRKAQPSSQSADSFTLPKSSVLQSSYDRPVTVALLLALDFVAGVMKCNAVTYDLCVRA